MKRPRVRTRAPKRRQTTPRPKTKRMTKGRKMTPRPKTRRTKKKRRERIQRTRTETILRTKTRLPETPKNPRKLRRWNTKNLRPVQM